MKNEDGRFLTEWGGECWHEWNADENKCSCGVKGRMLANYSCDYENRTFDNWEDFGWLWGKLSASSSHISWRGFTDWRRSRVTEEEWEYAKPSDRCQLICDFLREQEAGDANG